MKAARELARARDLIGALVHDLELARALARDVDLALVRARAHDLDRDLDSALARALARDVDLALVRARAHDLDRDLDSALARALTRARDLVRDLDRALDSDVVVHARDFIPGRRDPVRERVLDSALDRARDLALDLDRAGKVAKSGVHTRAERITAPAKRLVAVAARLLPAPDRARYGEEYRSELWDLAHAGAGRRQQLGYGLRQVRRAVPLRAAVLAPRSRKASP